MQGGSVSAVLTLGKNGAVLGSVLRQKFICCALMQDIVGVSQSKHDVLYVAIDMHAMVDGVIRMFVIEYMCCAVTWNS